MSETATKQSWVIRICPKCREIARADDGGGCVNCGEWLGGEGTGDDDHTLAVLVTPAGSP